MNVEYVNPFIESFTTVMPQLGFQNVKKGKLSILNKEFVGNGVVIIVGIVGAVKGNVVYSLDLENAMKIASIMMMGMPISEFDEMPQSAISELTNMLTANAATAFSNIGIDIDISTPTLLHGKNISVTMSASKALSVEIVVDEIPFIVNIAFESWER